MPTYNKGQIRDLLEEANGIPERASTLVERILTYAFRTEQAEEYACHGLARRIESICHSIGRLYEELPPDIQGIPDKKRRIEATIHIQSVAIHTYGCFDNLAQIWVAERNVRRANGKAIAPGRIGFSADRTEVRDSLPPVLQSAIEEFDPWLSFLEEFRHSTAHRIPLYVPPFIVDPKNIDEYNYLDREAAAALELGDRNKFDKMSEAQQILCSFRPMLALSINGGFTANFHPQLLADFATVEDWTSKILDGLLETHN